MEKIYQTLIDYLDSQVTANNLATYQVLEIGNPQSTGMVKCYREEAGVIKITYELFRIVDEAYINTIIENYK